jgi:hypothetical protein
VHLVVLHSYAASYRQLSQRLGADFHLRDNAASGSTTCGCETSAVDESQCRESITRLNPLGCGGTNPRPSCCAATDRYTYQPMRVHWRAGLRLLVRVR